MEPDLEYIDVLPPIKVDMDAKKMWVDGHEVKLITKLSLDPITKLITIEKYRVYCPEFSRPAIGFSFDDHLASLHRVNLSKRPGA